MTDSGIDTIKKINKHKGVTLSDYKLKAAGAEPKDIVIVTLQVIKKANDDMGIVLYHG